MAQRSSFFTAKVRPGSNSGRAASECRAMPTMRAMTMIGRVSRPPLSCRTSGSA